MNLGSSTTVLRTWRPSPVVRFVLLAVAWSLGLFALLKLPAVERGALIPFAQAQQEVACGLVGDAARRVSVGLSCTGADAIALCLGAIFAFPATWRRRLAGAGLGLLLITVVNTVRIGTLGLAVEHWRLFQALHVYVWPAALLLVVAGYVFLWMRRAQIAAPDPAADGGASGVGLRLDLSPAVLRFLGVGAVLVVAYVALSRWIHSSEILLRGAHAVAATAAGLLSVLGGEASVQGNIFRTANGSYLVTQECITSPLIPVWLTAALLLPRRAWMKLAAVAVTPLVFFLLGVARLSVLGLPLALLRSPFDAIHAFYQLLAGLIVVAVAARLVTEEWPSAIRRWAVAGAIGAATGVLLGTLSSRALSAAAGALLGVIGHAGHLVTDNQGAFAWLPGTQLAILAALGWALRGRWRRRRTLIGVALLLLSDLLLRAAWSALAVHGGSTLHVQWIRAWAVTGPVLLAWATTRRGATPRNAPRETTAADA